MVTFSVRQRLTAARALADLDAGVIDRGEINAVIYGAACAIRDGERIEGKQADKVKAMALLVGDDPKLAAFLGGTQRAALADDLTDLATVDARLLAEVLATANLAYETAAERVAIKLARRAKREKLEPVELWSLDNEGPLAFLASLRTATRRRITAALTDDESELVTGELETAAALVAQILEDASAEVVDLLPDGAADDVTVKHETDRPRAVALFVTAMSAFVLSRLNGEAPARGVPPNLAADVLRVAGGAGASEAGGVLADDDGWLTPDEEPFKGSLFAQGDTTSVWVEENEGLVAVQYFDGPTGDGTNPIHSEAVGMRRDEIQATPGSTAGCRHFWRTEYEEVA